MSEFVPERLATLPKVVDERDDECPIKIAHVACLSLELLGTTYSNEVCGYVWSHTWF